MAAGGNLITALDVSWGAQHSAAVVLRCTSAADAMFFSAMAHCRSARCVCKSCNCARVRTNQV